MQMCFLDIKSGAFQTFEQSLDLPAFLIGFDSHFRPVKTYKDLLVGQTVGCSEMCPYNLGDVTLEIILAAGTGIFTDLEMPYKINDFYLTFGISFWLP